MILSILRNVKLDSDTIDVHEKVKIRVLNVLIEKQASSASSTRIWIQTPKWKEKKGILTPYRNFGNYLFQTYATDDITDKTDADIVAFKQTTSMSLVKLRQVLWIIRL